MMSAKIYTFTIRFRKSQRNGKLVIKATTFRSALSQAIMLYRVNEKSISQIKKS